MNVPNNEEKEKINDLIDNWWLGENTEQNDIEKFNDEKNADNGFNIDYEPKLKKKKRSYNDMKGNIIRKLYDDEENKGESFPKFEPLLKI